MAGIFYGIGVGPGDSELLTVKATKILQKIDVVIAPKTEKKEGSVALNIARPYLKDDVQICYQVFPMVKDFQNDSSAWEANKSEIVGFLNAGKNVAFLTLGDPMFYSTYIYVLRLLQKDGINVETIPGIPAYVAIASKYNRPIVEGDDILSVIPATAKADDIKAALQASKCAVLMKVYHNFDEVRELLKENDMIDDALMVSRLGLENEREIDIKSVNDVKLNYLSTILTRRK